LARGLALRYAQVEDQREDLVQVASVGLMKAIDRYDPARGNRFTTFAVPTIIGELKRHSRDSAWAVRVPRDLQERVLAMTHAAETLCVRLRRPPTVRELAAELRCRPEEVLEAREAAAGYRAVGIDTPSDSDARTTVFEQLGAEDAGFELVEERATIATSWQALPELDRKIVCLRYFGDLTQQEIGECVGCSQVHVSRLIRRALDRLRLEATAA